MMYVILYVQDTMVNVSLFPDGLQPFGFRPPGPEACLGQARRYVFLGT
jgi:hypothetical protein